MIKNSLYIILLVLFSCCSDFKDIEIGEPENIAIKGIKDNMLRLEVKIPVANPGSFNIKIKEINLKTSVNNIYLGRLVSDHVIVIPAKSNEILDVYLNLKIASIIQGISIMLDILKDNNVTFQMEGYIKFKSLLINKKINIKETIFIDSFN
jgi:LEA14-like dessication related protein